MHVHEIFVILREMHEGVGGRHFWQTSQLEKCWMLSTSGQLYIGMHNNTINPIMLVNKPKISYLF